jgi:sterol desaturase/sphingolipid hydroxylase (fatty acid hydroxylase superfamily)
MLRLARYYGDFIVVPIMIVIAAFLAGLTIPSAALAIAGFIAWTFAEYLIHRLVHDGAGEPRSSHKHHHADPASIEVERSSATTPAITLVVAIILIVALGLSAGSAVLGGLLTGYLAFICTHHAVHRWTIYPTSPLHSARRRHALHHYRGPGNYGVTTSIWDRLFGTEIKRQGATK